MCINDNLSLFWTVVLVTVNRSVIIFVLKTKRAIFPSDLIAVDARDKFINAYSSVLTDNQTSAFGVRSTCQITGSRTVARTIYLRIFFMPHFLQIYLHKDQRMAVAIRRADWTIICEI